MHETLDQALQRIGITREDIRDQLLQLNALAEEAEAIIGNAEGNLPEAYDCCYLSRNGWSWAIYRGRCYPVKEGSKRYLASPKAAQRLMDIEQEIQAINDSYNPESKTVLITCKWLPDMWTAPNGDEHLRRDYQ